MACNASKRAADCLRRAAAWAQREGYPFPSLAGADLNRECSLHADAKNPKAPIVVYLPVLLQEKFMSTANFTYTPAQVKQLSSWTSAAITRCKGLIVEALRLAAERRR